MGYKHIQVPSQGDKITANEDNSLNVPNNPIIPYIEGDGIGVDISPVMIDVVDAAVERGLVGVDLNGLDSVRRAANGLHGASMTDPPFTTPASDARPTN